uniref:Uncharacterized protein n=1 Tax=viral metagenome TaxID=1070528 RepID=A0A6M3LYN4_9ZZZZ
MYKIFAMKNGKPVKIFKVEFVGNKIFAIHYRNEKGRITWDFPKDLDELKIEEE